jgi:bifunctional DNase/RNase
MQFSILESRACHFVVMASIKVLGCPSTNEGNFLELIKLLAKTESLLEQHVLLSGRNANYLSPDIQNDLIQSLSAQVLSNIVAEIKEAVYFAVIVDDSTIDISRTDQFSLSLRYVTANGDAVERFVQFSELPGTKAEVLFNNQNLFQQSKTWSC